MKRLNSKTGKPFKRGDLREADGARFIRYKTARIKSDGYFIEDWKKPERRSGKGIKRINPHTGQIFHRGDTRDEDDKIFHSYRGRTKKNGSRRLSDLSCSPSVPIRRLALSFLKGISALKTGFFSFITTRQRELPEDTAEKFGVVRPLTNG